MDRKPTYDELESKVKELEKELRDTKRAEEILWEAENIEQLLKVAPFGVFLIDLSGKIVACNENGAERLGKTTETAIGTVLRDHFPAKVSEDRRLKGMEAIQARQEITFEDQVEGRWYRNTIVPFFDKEGKPLRLAIYGADVTEYKNAVDALEKSEEKYRQLAELLPQVVYEIDEKGNITFANRIAFHLFGYTRADFEKGVNALQMLIPEDRERAVANMQKALRGEKPGGTEYTTLTKDGRTYPVMLYSNPIMKEEKPVGLRGIMVDLTEIKQAQEALRESEEKYRNILKSMEEGYYEVDLAGNFTFLNDALCRIRGYTKDELIGMNNREYMDPETAKEVYQLYNKVYTTGRPIKGHPWKIVRRDGTKGFVEVSASLIEDSHGKGIGFRGIVRDVTEKMQAEEELKASQQRLSQIIDFLPDATMVIDLDGKVIAWNRAIEEMTGIRAEDILGKGDYEYAIPFYGERRPVLIDLVGKWDKEIEKKYRYVKKEGESLVSETYDPMVKPGGFLWNKASLLYDRNGNEIGAIESIRDITDMKVAEEALRKSEERWQFALEGSRDGVWDWNAVTNEVFFSRRWKEMLGYNDDEISNHLDEWDKRVHPDDKEQCYADLNKHFNGEVPYYENEHRVLCKDGSYKWILDRGKVVSWTEANKPQRVIGTHTDITDRKRAEEQLRESQELLENILTASAVGIAHARDRKIIWANQAMARMFQFTREDQYIGQDTGILYADEAEYRRVGRLIYEQQRSGKVTEFDVKFKRRDDSLFDGYVKVNILDPLDPMKGIIVSIFDITDRKRAEEEREKLQAQLSDAVEMAHLGPWEYDVANDLFIFNDYFYKVFHTTAEQVGGYTMSSDDYARRFPYPDDIPVVREEIRKAIEATDTNFSRQLEHRILYPDGTVGYITVRYFIVKDANGRTVRTYGVNQDITERKLTEETLRESEERYRILVEESPFAISLIGKDGRYRYLNPKFTEIFGYHLEDIPTGREWFRKAYPDQEYRRQVISSWINDQEEAKVGEARPRTYAVKCKDGSEKTINFKPVTLETGEQFVICEDITEEKRAEQALRMERDRSQMYLDIAGVMFIALDANGNVTLANQKGCEILGYDEEEILGKSWFDHFLPREQKKEVKSVFKQLMEGVIEPVEYFENPIITKHGSQRYIAWHNALLRDEKENCIGTFSSGEDITERREAEEERARLEAQLQQAQKMEAIGTLAGGIAHDFNNILGAIIGHAELAKMKLTEESEAIVHLDQVMNAGTRAAKLVKQILTVSRQHQQEQRPVQIRYIVEEALKLLRSTLPTTIEIKKNLVKESGIINADPTQMHQVIMNLCTNAGHAMQKDGGVLMVKLANVEVDEIEAERHLDVDAGSYLRLTVSDTGHGMNLEIIERIFDPYFTTKDTGEGTGLGLAVAQGIVKAHGGAITVYSEPGKGTTFHVYLPVVLDAEREKKEPKEPLPTGSERILFIDDEEVLIEIGRQMLERLGYRVIAKTSSLEALELFQREPNRFDLVITDMTMPRMTGDKLAQEMIRIRPDIPIILCTGHSKQISEEKAKGLGIQAFVMKPITSRVVAETVRKVLDMI